MINNCEVCIFKSDAAKKLDSKQLKHLSENCASVTLKKGDILMQQGSLSSNIAYLKNGLAKIHIRGPHQEQLIKLIKSPAYLGLPNTFGDKINNYSVTVVENSDVCFIDINAFKNLLASNDKFAYEIILTLCGYELDSFKRCASRTQKQIRGNIADVLLDLSDRIYNSLTFALPLTRGEIGNYIDTSRESVCRVFSEFENDGIIKVSGKNITILKKDTLKLISENG
jgi:CRP/FNR family transcriptional regulator